MTTDDLRFKEIEHKFIVDDGFDLARFREQLSALGPLRRGAVHVRDRFFLTDGGLVRRVLFRHRYDAEARVWLEKWADYLEALTANKVVSLRAA